VLATQDALEYDPLMRFAQDRHHPLTRVYASAIELARSSARLPGGGSFGLPPSEFSALLDRYFPGARSRYQTQATRAAWHAAAQRQATDEFNDLLNLLLEHRADADSENTWLAHAIAACCMGDDHLWQDMGLANRQLLSDLLARYFPALYTRNGGGMRWKKFLYKQLCERNGAFVCRSPSCAECVEYANCFGPEEDQRWR